MYAWQTCPYYIGPKLLLWWKGVNYTEYKIKMEMEQPELK